MHAIEEPIAHQISLVKCIIFALEIVKTSQTFLLVRTDAKHLDGLSFGNGRLLLYGLWRDLGTGLHLFRRGLGRGRRLHYVGALARADNSGIVGAVRFVRVNIITPHLALDWQSKDS